MKINPQTEVTLAFGDLNEVRTLLLMCQQHHEARDLSDSAANVLPEVVYRPLTREINRVLRRVEGVLSAALLDAIEEDEETEEEPTLDNFDLDNLPTDNADVVEPEEDDNAEVVDLSSNPLGSRTITPKRSTFFDEEEPSVES